MNFELHYDHISGCTLNFSLGGAIVVFFLNWGVQLLRCTLGYRPDGHVTTHTIENKIVNSHHTYINLILQK